MSCRVALLKLERQNAIRLPASRGRPSVRRPVRRAVATCQRRRYGLSELQPIELVRVGSANSQVSRIWNDLMERHHPLGAGPLCGRQLRYLIRSPELGWPGRAGIQCRGLAAESARRLDRLERGGPSAEPESGHL